MSNLMLLGSIIRMCLFIQYNKQVLGNCQLDHLIPFQVHATPFLPFSSMVCNLHSNIDGAVLILRCKKNIMVPDYYIVGNLRNDYEETYSKLGHRWKDYAERKYDIIDKVQKDGLLLVGINPSFDESFGGPCGGEVRDSENGGYQHPYFSKPKKLNEKIGISCFSHVDMFSLRSRPQYVVQDIVNDSDSQDFVEEQLRLFRMIVDGASPRAIVVVNALASHLIRTRRALDALDYDGLLGVDMYKIGDKRVPVFYSGMLSGAHTIDNSSFDRLIWHIKYVLNMSLPKKK